jgi:predicted ribosome-associated RNA-binding protein Tma20
VDHGAVLDIAAGADLYAVGITAQYTGKPYTAVFMQGDVTDHRRVGRDVVAAAQ